VSEPTFQVPSGDSRDQGGVWDDVPPATLPPEKPPAPKEQLPFVTRVLEYGILIVVAVVIASLIRVFVGLAFFIPSESMYPTLKIGDRVVVSRISYRLHDPHRGDIVVFQNPAYRELRRNTPIDRLFRNLFDFVGARQPKDKNYVKRVIGLPGETLEIKNDAVFINGVKLMEPWLQPNVKTTPGPDGKTSFTIPPNSYFMMGDNRPESADSRYFNDPQGNRHPFVEKKTMVGRAFVRVWPATRLGGL
jgi:signal peptidase I